MGERDRRLAIPAVLFYRNSGRDIPLKIHGQIKGRPVVILKKLIDLGFKKGYFDKNLIAQLIEFGFDRGYWTDSTVFATPFKYFLFDKDWSKRKRIKVLDNNVRENNGNPNE